MAAYLISYDLFAPGKDYNDLYESIKSLGDYYHALGSEWFVDTYLPIDQIREKLKASMDSNDNVLITKLVSGYTGYLNQSAWDWLAKHI